MARARFESDPDVATPSGSPADQAAARFRLALDLFDAGEELMRQNLRRRNPGASDARIEELLCDWLGERPGAEHGDAWGRPGTWPRSR